MVRGLTFERAVAEGATSAQLLAIADWHRACIGKIHKAKKIRPADEAALDRHLSLVEDLTDVADRLAQLEAAA